MKSNFFSSYPRVSIITATFNCADSIENTIKSVRLLNYPNIEYIVIDGNSNDSTCSIVNRNLDLVTHFVSEDDEGIADAWNKGLQISSGDFICFLNSGDAYHPEFINDHLKNFLDRKRMLISYGITLITDNKFIVEVVDRNFNPLSLTDGFNFLHTSVFTSKDLYSVIGNFHVGTKIAFDTEWLLRALKLQIPFIKSTATNFMEVGGVSDKNWFNAQLEYQSHLQKKSLINKISILSISKLYLKSVNRNLHLLEKIRSLKLQLIFTILAFFNFIHNLFIFGSIRKILYLLAKFRISNTAVINGSCKFFSFRRLTVGSNSIINTGVYLDNRAGINIGSNVSISHDVKIYTLGHDINSDLFITKGKSVYIDDYVVIFAGAILMPGVKVSKGAVIYPYSVVYDNVGEMEVVAGNPAKLVRKRNSLLRYKLKYNFLFAV